MDRRGPACTRALPARTPAMPCDPERIVSKDTLLAMGSMSPSPARTPCLPKDPGAHPRQGHPACHGIQEPILSKDTLLAMGSMSPSSAMAPFLVREAQRIRRKDRAMAAQWVT